MKTTYLHLLSMSLAALLSGMTGCNTTSKETTVKSTATETSPAVTNELFKIAPAEYATLSEQALTHFAKFDFDTWGTMLADNVEYDFPDGDQFTRTKLMGKTAVLDWWKNFRKTSGVESMTLSDFNNTPIDVTGQPKGGAMKGVYVLSYFTNKLVIKGKPVGLRMNFAVHFNADKKIDRYTTFYDRTPIIKAMNGRNLLDETKAKAKK